MTQIISGIAQGAPVWVWPLLVGLVVGDDVGLVVGLVVGDDVGDVVGLVVGLLVGEVVGLLVGLVVGDAVGPTHAGLSGRTGFSTEFQKQAPS